MRLRGWGIRCAAFIRSKPGNGLHGSSGSCSAVSSRGSVIDEINRSVLDAARAFRPDLVWGEKQEFLRVETLAALRQLGARLVHFTPDPYFSLAWKRTPLMDKAISCFDVLVYCKSYEREQYAALGKPLIYMPLGYCDEVHRPLPSDDPRWSCAVGFLGGWEPRRETSFARLAAAGIDLKIRGGYWDFLRDGKWTLRRQFILSQLAGRDSFHIHQDELLGRAWQGGEVYADDYARALSGAKIGLGLLTQSLPGSAYDAHVRNPGLRQHADCGSNRRASRAVRRGQGGGIFYLSRGTRRQNEVLLR